jgi:disulfide bond formation protein DsbB
MTAARDRIAGLLAGGVSAALLSGALLFQYAGGLPPCEMCHWQRWPHIGAALFGLIGCGLLAARFSAGTGRALALLAILSLALSGVIGVFHAGVEWGWWEGLTACTGLGFTPGALDGPDAFRIVRCDVAAWRFLGLSLAGYNALISLGAAGLSLALMRRRS